MNWERVHFIYYVYTSMTVILMLLALGKFFCVGKLYEVYTELNHKMDNTLGVIIAFFALVEIAACVSLFFVWENTILFFCVIMTMFGGICAIWFTIVIIAYCYEWLKSYHYRLKRKKNL